MSSAVSIVVCNDYEPEKVRTALSKALSDINGLDFIKPNMKIGIKVNLVTFLKPEKAATTHPQMVTELCRIITEKGAIPIIGDSPGGPFTSINLKRVYSVTGMYEAEEYGAKLNMNFSQSNTEFKEAVAAKKFTYTSWLDDVDAIINFSKLKTHGMMGMSACVKNMFGVIPGTMKPEYHFLYPNAHDFADMLIDLNEYFKPQLNIIDAVTGMEGNGPTAGDPKHIGAVIASKSPYNADLVAAKIIGINKDSVPTLQAAYRRGLAPQNAKEVETFGNVESFIVKDYKLMQNLYSIEFGSDLGKIAGAVVKYAMCSKPVVKRSECVGCKKCYEVCPPKAIIMKRGKPQIDRKKCIRCFCCQEFCPKGAMEVHRPKIAALLSKL